MYLDALEMGFLEKFFVPIWKEQSLFWSLGVGENAGAILKN